MSLRTRKHDAKAAAKAGAANARRQARLARKQVAPLAKSARQQARDATTQVAPLAKSARQQAQQARKQVTPLAKSARDTAQQSIYDARVWAAPRVERSGHALQERIAPKVSAMLVATARRVEPAQPVRRRRWPKVLAGMVMVAAGSVVAAVLRGRRDTASTTTPSYSAQPTTPPAGPASGHPAADAETADVNGQVRTP